MKTLKDLSTFLHDWYGESPGSLALNPVAPAHPVAQPLLAFWRELGRLCTGYEAWIETGASSPLACQDGLASPERIRLHDGLIHFLFENQGNWSMAYRVDDASADPIIVSDMSEQYGSGTGYQPTGARLSNLLITSALIETTFFASNVAVEVSQELAASCTVPLWTGTYYPDTAQDALETTAPHRFSVNSDRTLLRADIDVGFGPIIADQSTARQRWRALTAV